MGTDETVIRQFVDAVGSGNGEAAAALTAEDAVIELPGGTTLSGPDGARQFAAKHGEQSDGTTALASLTSLDPLDGGRHVATLRMTTRDTATGSENWSLEVGGLISVRDGLVSQLRAFPSAEEARAAAQDDANTA
jgi:ketosteroid isomerase-like protein